MGWRFRNSIRVAPGVRLNLGKRGASLSVGGRGATVNIGRKGVRTTVGVPGTGISYTTNTVPLSGQHGQRPGLRGGPSVPGTVLLLMLVGAIILVVVFS